MTTEEGDISLAGRVVLVSGAASGLGLAMAEALVAHGAEVVVADRNAEGAAAAAERLGDRASAVAVDISSEESVAELFERALDRHGHVDVLVNNAGIGMGEVRAGDRYAKPISVFEVTPDHVSRFFSVHVLGSFLMTRAAIPPMVARGWGRIVTVTTSLGTMLRPGNAPYGPMKAASEAFTSIFAGDLEGTGVTANILVPGGGADTPMVPDIPGRSRADLVPPSVMEAPIVWLASNESDGVTGRRFVGRLWDPTVPRAVAVAAASFPVGWADETPGR